MDVLSSLPPQIAAQMQSALVNHWGIRTLRPLQGPAIRAVLENRDSLVVLPTGGGKSLCYQAPAVVQAEMTVVVSPLISLMKDQVDGLRSSGINATRLDSSLTLDERLTFERQIRAGVVRLLFVSPERLLQNDLCDLLKQTKVNVFAIDEAHCISHWGHDFRTEYRQLQRLREIFPGVSIHAYTATATEQVRKDIIDQLGLRDPEVLIGSFDRPNLTYRVHSRRGDLQRQVLNVLDRHREEGGIIYCISRADVDSLAAKLASAGVSCMPYHAGLSAEQRTLTQDSFLEEKCDVVVATVAFGMGIDRSNVRFVLHTGMPKSIEHYQQETGRAGRDGLEAECVLLYSGADFLTWRSLINKSAGNENERAGSANRSGGSQNADGARSDSDHASKSLFRLQEMERFCRSPVCRHKSLVNYFGQIYENENCGACDFCLEETALVPESHVVAQKILSCFARLRGRFGIGYLISVLRGEKSSRIQDKGHDQLSTYGILSEYKTDDIRDWVYQLIGQGVLQQIEIDGSDGRSFPVLMLNEGSRDVMRNQRTAKLLQPVPKKKKKGSRTPDTTFDSESRSGVDKDLFEKLRALRRKLASQMGVPPYIVFTDATLRDFSRLLPRTHEEMREISGVGEKKLRDFGEIFCDAIKEHCSGH